MALQIVKTIQADLMGITAVASAVQSWSREIDVDSAISGLVMIDFGLDSATTPVGTEFQVLTSQESSGDDAWRALPGCKVITGTVAPTAIVCDAGVALPVGSGIVGNPILIGAGTPALNDDVFFKNTVIGNSEWVHVEAISAGTSFTINNGLRKAQVTGVTVYNKAEHHMIPMNLENIKRLIVRCNNNYAASSASIVWRARLITTEITTV
jgi:hypothetical protein